MNPLLHDLQKKQLVWRAASIEQHKERVSTGYQTLDKALNGGFPKSGLVHIKSLVGLGEMRLVLPAIKAQAQKQFCAFVAAPFLLNAEFLIGEGLTLDKVMIIDITHDKHSTEQKLWSAEQCAKSGACAAIFIWHERLQVAQAKKLELAAIKGQCLIFLFEAGKHQQANLPVSLAMSLSRDKRDQQAVNIKVDKQKVGWPLPSFSVKVPYKARMGSPMHKRRGGSRHTLQAANIYALHSKPS